MFPLASLAFVGGIVTGSFVGLVAHRLPRGRSIVAPRSVCDSCGVQIAGYDNIPVASWLILRGRCRSCASRIPALYPIVELALGIAFAATAVVLRGDPAQLALGLLFVAMLAAITLTDLERQIIPNSVLLAGAVAGFLLVAVTDPASLPERLIAAGAAGGLLLAIGVAYPRGMGMGDVKLAAVMGLYLGSAVAPALMVAVFSGTFVGLGLMLARGSEARKLKVPFGPFLALGGIVGLLAGDQLLQAYLNAFVR
jgi:leader peptidase (prepilin peptidase)/N-methyltransferase